MLKDHIILSILWISYCGIHSILASPQLKRTAGKLMRSHFKYYRLYYNLFALITLIIVLWYLDRIPSVFLFERSTITTMTGILFGIAGLTLMVICIKKYFTSLSGIKSLFVTESPSGELMITGIHKYLRHPLYAGTFLFIWGLWLIIPLLSFLITTVIITIYTLIGITWEEQKLEAEFGDNYRRYKQQVPKLIPSLTSLKPK